MPLWGSFIAASTRRASAASRSAPSSAILRKRANRIATGVKAASRAAGQFSGVNRSSNLAKGAHAKEIAGRVRFVAERAVIVVLRGHHECERIASNAKCTSLVAEEKAPATERLRETIFVARVDDRTRTRNHDDTRRSGQRARMRHRRIVHQSKTLRRHLRPRTVDAAFITTNARDDCGEIAFNRNPCTPARIGECFS